MPPESKWPTFIGSASIGVYGPSEQCPTSFELAPDIWSYYWPEEDTFGPFLHCICFHSIWSYQEMLHTYGSGACTMVWSPTSIHKLIWRHVLARPQRRRVMGTNTWHLMLSRGDITRRCTPTSQTGDNGPPVLRANCPACIRRIPEPLSRTCF